MFTVVARRLAVQPGWVTLEYRDGAPARVLQPGRYRRRTAATYVAVATREQLITIGLQEILTDDAISVRVSAAVRFVVTDPVRYTEAAHAPLDMVYLATQVALRTECAAVTVEDLMRRSTAIDSGRMLTAVRAASGRLGIEIREVILKDVVVPGEIRSAAVELATTRARGLARLEAARSDTAAMRARANVGKLLERYPALSQLQMIEAAPAGTSFVLTVGSARADGGPIPVETIAADEE